MGAKPFRSTLTIALVCMLVPVLVAGLTSAALTNRASAVSFFQERTQQLELIRKSCDLLLDECSYIYHQTLVDEDMQRALGSGGLTRPMPYAKLRSVRTLMHNLDLIACSRPHMHSILVYDDNPLGLTVSSLHGLVTLRMDPDRGWYPYYEQHQGTRPYAVTREVAGYGEMLTFFMPISSALQPKGVMVFHYDLEGLRALLPDDGTRWLVLDEQGALLFSSDPAYALSGTLHDAILAMSPGEWAYPPSTPAGEDASAVLYQVRSDAYGWRYVNIADRAMISQSGTYINRTMGISTLIALAVSLLVAIWLTRIALRQEMTRRQLRLREAEMLALQAQINPHFMYNTLELVNWRAIAALGETNTISHVVTTLSDLLRYALERPGELVPLVREVEHARRYAELMRFRLGSIFEMSWLVSDAAGQIPVPKLILQPLIENAIQHGIQPKGEGGHISVDIACHPAQKRLILTVADNGVGMPPETLDALRTQLSSFDGLQYAHIGLFNVYQRIRLVFADQAIMHIDSTQDIGTRITCEIPIPQGGNQHANLS